MQENSYEPYTEGANCNTTNEIERSKVNSKMSYGRMMITKPGLQKIEKTHGLQTRKLKKENSDLLLSSKDNDMETTLHQQVLHSPILKVSQIKNKKKPPIRERRLSQPEIDNSKLSPFN